MPMNFVVEDGTGKTDATSYATVAQYKQHCLDRAITVPGADTDALIQAYLNKATEYIESTYEFLGVISDVDQALKWPRALNPQNYYYEDMPNSDEIPSEIIKVVCYLANMTRGADFNPVDEGLKSYSIGPVSKTFGRGDGYKSYPFIDKLLKRYITSGCKLARVN